MQPRRYKAAKNLLAHYSTRDLEGAMSIIELQ